MQQEKNPIQHFTINANIRQKVKTRYIFVLFLFCKLIIHLTTPPIYLVTYLKCHIYYCSYKSSYPLIYNNIWLIFPQYRYTEEYKMQVFSW